MKAITVKENNTNSPIEDCFGKTRYFCLIDDLSCKIEFVLNPGNNLPSHSGKKAVAFLASLGVTSVISGNYGITVKKLLDKHGIQTVIIPSRYETLSQLLGVMKPADSSNPPRRKL